MGSVLGRRIVVRGIGLGLIRQIARFLGGQGVGGIAVGGGLIGGFLGRFGGFLGGGQGIVAGLLRQFGGAVLGGLQIGIAARIAGISLGVIQRLQRRSGGEVVPDAFSHGTADQRVRWFRRGFDDGDPARCDTFGAAAL